MSNTNEIDPSDNVTADDRRTITLRVSHKDWLFVKGCDADHGSISTTFRTYLTKLVHECKQRGITDFSQTNEFRNLVNSTVFVPDDSIVITRAELEQLRIDSAEWQRLCASSGGGLRHSATPRSRRQSDGHTKPGRAKGKGRADKAAPNPAGLQSGSGSGDTNAEGQSLGGTDGKTS